MTSTAFRSSGRGLPQGYEVRSAKAADRLELADLMMDAYVGTIDYGGETPEQAVEEIDDYLAGEAYLAASRVAVLSGVLQSAVLMSRLAGVPTVGYVMTRAVAKGQGLAHTVLDAAADAVWATGTTELRAFVTERNMLSETIFLEAGFEVIASYGD